MKIGGKLFVDYYIGGLLHVCMKPIVMLVGKALHRSHDLRNTRELTVVKLLGGGSLIVALPSLLGLKQSGKFRRFTLVTTPAVKPFAEVLGVFDRYLIISDRSWWRFIGTSLRTIASLFRADTIIDLEIHSRLSVVFTALTCARNRIAFSSAISFWRKGLATHLLYFNPQGGIYIFYDQLALLFGCQPADWTACREAVKSTCSLGDVIGEEGHIAIIPGCSDLGLVRMLTLGQWERITVDYLHGLQGTITIHLIGGRKEHDFCEAIRAALIAKLAARKATIVNHAGQLNLKESVRTIACCQKVLSIDTGLLHLARAIGISTRSFWGPTDPSSLLRPGSNVQEEVLYKRLQCSPCLHVAYPPPCRGNNLCMQQLTVDGIRRPEESMWLLCGHKGECDGSSAELSIDLPVDV